MSEDKGSLINIELIPKELITNVLGPATKSIGEGLGGIANFVMGPLRKLNIVSEKSYQDFVKKVNAKTNEIPPENRDDSKLGLALKTMEDARYQLENEDMRNYFSNLLAGLIDNRKNTIASPRFSTILSNLTTEEASLLNKIFKSGGICAVVTIRYQKAKTSKGIDVVQDLLLFDNEYINSKVTLDSIESYGLIEIDDRELLADKFSAQYSSFENSQEFKNIESDLHLRYENDPFFKDSEVEVKIQKKSLLITQLGNVFCSMVFSTEEE